LNMDDNINDYGNDITSSTSHVKTKDHRNRGANHRRNNKSKKHRKQKQQLYIDALRLNQVPTIAKTIMENEQHKNT